MSFLQPKKAVTLQDLAAVLAASPHLECQPCEDRDPVQLACCLGGWLAQRRAPKPRRSSFSCAHGGGWGAFQTEAALPGEREMTHSQSSLGPHQALQS